MVFDPIAAVAAQASPAIAAQGKDDPGMGKDDFLKLLVAQLQGQDPLNPQDPSEFTAQLTQYSSLEQLVNLNSSFETMAQVQSFAASASLAGFIGKDARVLGNAITVKDGTPTSANYTMSAAGTVEVKVFDKDGKLVDTVDLGNQQPGSQKFTWDGKTETGATVPDGNYTFKITATDAQGNTSVPPSTFVGRIESMVWNGGVPMLKINGQLYPAGDLLEVGETVVARGN